MKRCRVFWQIGIKVWGNKLRHLYVLSGNTEKPLAFTVTAGKISAPAIVPSRVELSDNRRHRNYLQ